MKHTFALTTRQTAKLAGCEIPPIYMSVKRYGNWRGIIPSKTPSGRLLWRSDEVHSTLGLVPSPADMTNGESFFCQFLEDEALPVTGETWALVQALLSEKIDEGRDPDLYLNDVTLGVELVAALCERIDQALPAMNERTKNRAMSGLQMISHSAGSFLDKEADCA